MVSVNRQHTQKDIKKFFTLSILSKRVYQSRLTESFTLELVSKASVIPRLNTKFFYKIFDGANKTGQPTEGFNFGNLSHPFLY